MTTILVCLLVSSVIEPESPKDRKWSFCYQIHFLPLVRSNMVKPSVHSFYSAQEIFNSRPSDIDQFDFFKTPVGYNF